MMISGLFSDDFVSLVSVLMLVKASTSCLHVAGNVVECAGPIKTKNTKLMQKSKVFILEYPFLLDRQDVLEDLRFSIVQYN